MRRILLKFRRDEAGAITVDWVVLTAIVMASVLLLTTPLGTSLSNLLATISGYLDATGAALAAKGSALD